MRDFEYIDYIIQQLSYENNLDEDDYDMDIEVSVNYSLNFDEESRMAFGECDIFVDDDMHQDKLTIHIKAIGIFSYNINSLTDDIRKKCHIESLRILNPKWRDTLLKVTELVEIPPIELEDLQIDEAEVFIDNSENLN